MAEANRPQGVHLVGSIPVQTAEEAFRLATEHLGGHLKRLPDGEVGERDTWIRWQYARIGASPQVELSEKDNIYVPVRPFSVSAGVQSADDIEFPNLGYADAAIASYAVFERLSSDGVIPSGMRFQVGMPTPLSVSLFYIEPGSRPLFEAAYSRALGNELETMLEQIPAKKLAIQWETVTEFALLEGLMENHVGEDLPGEITTRVAALVDRVPEPAEVGLHLCYGDSGHKHFCEPADAGHLALVAGEVLEKAGRSVAWIHMPVPKGRDDDAYFAPLASLDLPDPTDLFLGLIHQTGGRAGNERRIDTASRSVERFGIATECGLGRREPDTIPDLLRQHAELAGPFPG